MKFENKNYNNNLCNIFNITTPTKHQNASYSDSLRTYRAAESRVGLQAPNSGDLCGSFTGKVGEFEEIWQHARLNQREELETIDIVFL